MCRKCAFIPISCSASIATRYTSGRPWRAEPAISAAAAVHDWERDRFFPSVPGWLGRSQPPACSFLPIRFPWRPSVSTACKARRRYGNPFRRWRKGPAHLPQLQQDWSSSASRHFRLRFYCGCCPLQLPEKRVLTSLQRCASFISADLGV